MDYSYLQTPGFKALLKEISKLQEITSYRNAASTLQTTRAMFESETFQNAVKSINNSLSPIFDNVQNIGEIVRSSTIPAETLRSISNRYSDLFKDLNFQSNRPAIENLKRLNKSLTETLSKTVEECSEQSADIDKNHISDASGHIDTDYANLNWDHDSPDEFYSFDEQTLSQIEESIGTLPNECKQTDDTGRTKVPKAFIKYLLDHLIEILQLIFMIFSYMYPNGSITSSRNQASPIDVEIFQRFLHSVLSAVNFLSKSLPNQNKGDSAK